MFVLHSRRGLVHSHPLSAELSRSSHTSFFFWPRKKCCFHFRAKQGSFVKFRGKSVFPVLLYLVTPEYFNVLLLSFLRLILLHDKCLQFDWLRALSA